MEVRPTEGGANTGVHPSTASRPKRFHGCVALDPLRAGADARKIAEEVIAHLLSLSNAKVSVMLEIQATVPGGLPEKVGRIVTENARPQRFSNQGFEND